jgi:hypothetical protein
VSQINQLQKVSTHTLSFHLTAADAATALAGGRDGSSPSRVGNNLWMAHKITYVINTLFSFNLGQPKMVVNAGRSVPPLN